MERRMAAKSVVMGMVVLMVAMGVRSQESNDCISQILPCANYINTTTTPPSACCVPLLKVINNDLQCLCNVLKSNIINSFNFTLAQALALPARCGQNVSTNACSVGTPTATPTAGGNSPGSSSATINSAAAISVSTLIAMALVAFLLDGDHGFGSFMLQNGL